MENIDSAPSNVQSSRQEALLYVFEDNEAVIKMIIKGRSPTMRHGGTPVHIWKSHVRVNKLDVQESNVSFTQFNGI